jgi:hypothetical protein
MMEGIIRSRYPSWGDADSKQRAEQLTQVEEAQKEDHTYEHQTRYSDKTKDRTRRGEHSTEGHILLEGHPEEGHNLHIAGECLVEEDILRWRQLD